MTEINTATTLTCYAHPGRETSLRCKRCERPICASCAVRTPTGYMCKDCVRIHQKAFETAVWYDYLLGFATTTFLSMIASAVITFIAAIAGWFMFIVVLLIGTGAGSVIARITLAVLRKHRSKALFLVTAAGMVAGALPVILFMLFGGNYFSILYQVVYLVVATPTVYTQISGIQLSR
jgi:hypothetical protein